jgi:hypothetical protein
VLLFSPTDKKSLYLGTQFVMKTTDGGLHWETISPDLTGAVSIEQSKSGGPATIENAKQRGYGVVTTIAPSTLKDGLIWAGSDTGLIHLTRDGGQSWKDVTPPGLSAWSEVALIEASHFDPGEAYAAVDRHRLDDQKPYLFRTRDYGASWQPITDGITAPSFLRAIREDPGKKGLLFAGTELGLYFSNDDGDHWQPLQLNLPAVSVQDMTIHGDDLVIATHGRAFWVLDDISPLRQINEVAKAEKVWLYRPSEAVRIDNDNFLGTPLPPDEPAAENPPNGAIFDYYLPKAVAHVKLEILDAQNDLVRVFSSDDEREPKQAPVPIAERWLTKPEILETAAGMHRFVWNLAWGAKKDSDQLDEGGDAEPRGPRAVPGMYQVRLTVDGKAITQPLEIAMDPRSSATGEELAQQLQWGRQIYADTLKSRRVLSEMKSTQKQLAQAEQRLTAVNAELRSSMSQMEAQIGKLVGSKNELENGAMGLEKANTGLLSALGVVASSDRTVPSQAIAVYEESAAAMRARISEWNQLKGSLLPQLNDKLRQAKLAPIAFQEDPQVEGER